MIVSHNFWIFFFFFVSSWTWYSVSVSISFSMALLCMKSLESSWSKRRSFSGTHEPSDSYFGEKKRRSFNRLSHFLYPLFFYSVHLISKRKCEWGMELFSIYSLAEWWTRRGGKKWNFFSGFWFQNLDDDQDEDLFSLVVGILFLLRYSFHL